MPQVGPPLPFVLPPRAKSNHALPRPHLEAQQRRRQEEEVERETFVGQVRDEVWIPTVADGREILSGVAIGMERMLLAALSKAAKNLVGPSLCKRTFGCPEAIWRQYFWGRFSIDERKSKGPGRFGLYRAEIATSSRLQTLFGDNSFYRQVQLPKCFVFIAPKAYAVQDWSGGGTKMVNVRQGSYMAVLATHPNSHYAVVFLPTANTYVDYQGKRLQGRIGLCDKAVLQYETPFYLQYSPRTHKVTATFACWVFNSSGRLQGTSHRFIILD